MISKTEKLSNIQIPESFISTKPKDEKIQKFMNEYISKHDFDKRILITPSNLLVDGYARYVALQKLGVEKCIVNVLCKENYIVDATLQTLHVKDNRETMYIYGIHPTSHTDKEYVWRVPNKPKFTSFRSKVRSGDIVYVMTKYGIMPITVTKTENKCVSDDNIKVVVKPKILRGGEIIEN